MPLADDFTRIVESLPPDWTDMELALRIKDIHRYIEAATYTVVCNAQPLSRNEWHWRILVANHFGHAAAPSAVHSALRGLDNAGIEGELQLRDVREGRVEVQPMWGRPESVRQERRRIFSQ